MCIAGVTPIFQFHRIDSPTARLRLGDLAGSPFQPDRERPLRQTRLLPNGLELRAQAAVPQMVLGPGFSVASCFH